MSTQLILFPQRYRGYISTYHPGGGAAPEYVVDGVVFSTINSSTSATFSGTANQTIINNPPTNINKWYRVRTVATLSYPTTSSALVNSLVFTTAIPVAPHTTTRSYAYQKLSNLIVGAQYTLKVNSISNATGGQVAISSYNGTTLAPISFLTTSSILATRSMQFTAQTANDIIMVDVLGTVANTVGITNISVKETNFSPSGAYTELNDGQVICDLYEEEDIPLSLSIDDFKNVAEQVKSYSKDFNLPATKRNNQIFNNMFEITRVATGLIFNPYVKTRCILKQNGFILFEGYLRMIDIKDKEGEISYNVNLYSEVVALKDVLKDATFSDLDFSELNHNYNKTSITDSWLETAGTGLPLINALTNPNECAGPVGATVTQVLKYPFIDWTHQYLIADGLLNNATIGNPELTSLEQAFRPCIQLKYLINKIFENIGFSWTSEFFDGADFERLFMDFNWGSDNTPVEIDITTFQCWYLPSYTTSGILNYATTAYSVMELSPPPIPFIGGSTPPNYNNTTDVITSTVVNEVYGINYLYTIENTDTVDREIECQWLYNSTPINHSGVQTLAANGGTYSYTGNFNQIMHNSGDTLQVQFRTNTGTASKVRQADCSSLLCNTATVVFNVSAESITTNTILQTLRGELGQWEFLKGIMTMFNLVSMVDENNPNNILIEPYGDVFINITNSGNTGNLTLAARSIEHDWTDKVDVSQMELKPLTDLNKTTKFQFVEDDDDRVFNVLKQAQNGHLYGSLEFDASTSSQNLSTVLEGTKEIIAEPFAATVSKPIESQFSDFVVPAIYARNDDGTYEGFDNSPRIFYNNGIKSTGASFYIPAQNGLTSGNPTLFLQFSHLSAIPSVSTTTKDFVFASAQLIVSVGNPPIDNLYSTYWQPYFNELYHPDTRIMTLKVNLNPSDIARFKFYDKVMIKNRSFRVNRIDYKPNELATVEFILIP